MSLLIFIPSGEWATIINIKNLFRSLRTKVFFIFLVVSIVPLIIIVTMLITTFSDYYHEDTKSMLFRQANTISLNLDAYFSRGDETYLNNIDAIVEGRALIIDGIGNVIYDTNDISTGKLFATPEVISGLQGESSYVIDDASSQALVVVPIYTNDQTVINGAVILSKSLDDIGEAMGQLTTISSLMLLVLAILILVMSVYISGNVTKPFTEFLRYTKGVTDGYIHKKLELTGNYEVEAISTSYNHMIEKLWEVDESRQQFVANVSHELKTPLSSVKVLAESLLHQENVPEELYQEFLQDINNEIDRESKIINDLLTLVRLDKNDDILNITKVNVNKLVEDVLKRLKPLTREKNLEMVFESYRNIIAEIDEVKYQLVITNLVENAIKYNRDYGLIKVTLNADHREFTLKVKDTGIGIPEDSREKIFDRFYRVDKTRSRDTGGTGLGLSIVHKTVIMHNGSIVCDSEEDKGTTFTIKNPLKFIKM